MKVVLIAKSDWCSFGGHCAKGLRELGVDATMYIQREHSFKYPDQGTLFKNVSQILPQLKEADVIVFMHTQYTPTGVNLKGKKVFVWHTGSRYRSHSKEMNKIFNPIVNASICGRDVFGLGAKNEKWIGGLVDTDDLKPVYKMNNDKVILSHYPRGVKGAGIIKSTIQDLTKQGLLDNVIFKLDDKLVSWQENIKRVSECDVYIEDMSRGKNFSVFGIAALEAAALGKIVITRFLFFDEYEKIFGKCGLQVANTSEELAQKLLYITSLPKEHFLKLQHLSREWVVKCHSYESVAKRLLKLFNEA